MKKFTQLTLIALLISTVVFSQKGGPGKQEAPSQTAVIVMGAHSNSILLSPSDGKIFTGDNTGKPVLFRWTPIVPKPKEPVTYRLRVWQLMQGQNLMEAVKNNQPVMTRETIDQTTTAISNLYTGPCHPPAICSYVWAVDVLSAATGSVAQNSSHSELYRFAFEGFDTDLDGISDGKVKHGGNQGNAGNSGAATGYKSDDGKTREPRDEASSLPTGKSQNSGSGDNIRGGVATGAGAAAGAIAAMNPNTVVAGSVSTSGFIFRQAESSATLQSPDQELDRLPTNIKSMDKEFDVISTAVKSQQKLKPETTESENAWPKAAESNASQADPIHGVIVKRGLKKQDKDLDKSTPQSKAVQTNTAQGNPIHGVTIKRGVKSGNN